MYAVSSAFADALAGKYGGKIIFRADLLRNGVAVVSGLRVTGGSVEVDGNADVRRRCSLTVVDDTGVLVPNDAGDPLSPYGNEVRVYRGVSTSATGDELVPLGTFRIASAHVDSFGVIAVQGFDRARAVSRARFETPYTVPSGIDYSGAIVALITSRLPYVTTSVAAVVTSTSTVLVFDQGSDPWEAAQNMAESIGCELFFDPMGVCVLRPRPDPVNDPIVATYAPGATATILSVENALDDEPGYNGVVVDGEPPNLAPVHAVVYDADPASPTYANGPYGKVPMFYRSQYITTIEQATAAANAFLRANRGGTEQLTFEAIPNPAHDAGDLVRVTRTEIGVDDAYVVESFGIPLAVDGSMKVTTRKRRTQ